MEYKKIRLFIIMYTTTLMRDDTAMLLHSIFSLSLPPENRKSYGFLMFSGGREKVHWE